MNKAEFNKRFFRSTSFFRSDFPFTITRMTHTPTEYNETMRCQRDFWKIIYVISGHGRKIINDRHYPMKAGSLFVIHPEDETTFDIKSKRLEIFNILFMPNWIKNGLRELESEYDFFSIFGQDFNSLARDYRDMLYILDSNKKIEQMIKQMENEFEHEASNYQNMIKLQLQELLIHISRLSSKKVSLRKKENVAHYVAHIIDSHYHEDFDLTKLAKHIGVSKSHLCRIFKEKTGVTIMESLLERRLAEAEKMLKNANNTISYVCYACGFNSLSYFYRAFTAKNDLNPGQFKKCHSSETTSSRFSSPVN